MPPARIRAGLFPFSVPILLFGLGLAARDAVVVLVALAGSVAAPGSAGR